ncbi:MAG: hypothetical protein ACE10K_10100 [Rhodothermales bacterium]
MQEADPGCPDGTRHHLSRFVPEKNYEPVNLGSGLPDQVVMPEVKGRGHSREILIHFSEWQLVIEVLKDDI